MKVQLYDCGCCGAVHPADWWGDCREDVYRLPTDLGLEAAALRRWIPLDTVFLAIFDTKPATDGCDTTCYQVIEDRLRRARRVWASICEHSDPVLPGEYLDKDVRMVLSAVRSGTERNPYIMDGPPGEPLEVELVSPSGAEDDEDAGA